MDKVQKIREEVVRMHNLLPVVDGDNIYLNYADRICTTLEMYIDSLQEEPQVKESAEIQHVNDMCKENGSSLTQEPTSNVWHDMSEDAENGRNTIIIYPKGFYGAVLMKGGSQLKNHNKERYVKWAYIDDIININITNKEEPVNDELEKAAAEAFKQIVDSDKNNFLEIFKAGAKWQKENLWKPADGDDLPEYDREVIAILDYDFGHYKVVYAHRPNPNGWNGTNIDTEEKEHFEPATYDKGGWNQPHVLYWLDTKMPYEESEIDEEVEL